jgi:hypothetical protein
MAPRLFAILLAVLSLVVLALAAPALQAQSPDRPEDVIRTMVVAIYSDALFAGAPSSREPSGVLDAAAAEMPLVEVRAGEFFRMPSGRVVEGGSTEARKVLIGLFGPVELPFVVCRAGADWRIEAEPSFALMMQ